MSRLRQSLEWLLYSVAQLGDVVGVAESQELFVQLQLELLLLALWVKLKELREDLISLTLSPIAEVSDGGHDAVEHAGAVEGGQLLGRGSADESNGLESLAPKLSTGRGTEQIEEESGKFGILV